MANVSQEVLDRQPAAILARAIQKAVDNDWKPHWIGTFDGIEMDVITGEFFALWNHKGYHVFRYSLTFMFFDHGFAKALWGDDTITRTWDAKKIVLHEEDEDSPVVVAYTAYEYHLQQMVISPDPIKYLGDNI